MWAVVLVRLLLPVQLFTSSFGAGSIAKEVDIAEPVRQVYASANEERYEQEYDEAYRYGKACTNISHFLMGAACLIGYPMLPILLKQHNPSPEVAAMATNLLYWSLISLLLFYPKSCTLPAVLRAGSDTMYPTIVSMVVLWVFTIGMGYILAIPMGLGLNGTWIAMWTAWAVRSTLFAFRYRSKKWLYMTDKKVDSKA